MSVIEVDVFSLTSPNTSSLGTITDEMADIAFRVGYRGDPGELTIRMNRHHADADLIAPDRIYKVKVPLVQAGYLAAFVYNEAEYGLLDVREQGAEFLLMRGVGLKALLKRARLLWHPYAPDQPARGSADLAHDEWTWIDEPPGAIATRALEEGINQPGEPLADFSLTFDRVTDTNSDPWDTISGEYRVKVGTDLLTVIEGLEEAGDFYLEIEPDLTVNAYQSYSGRDLTATVHFQEGQQILSGMRRRLNAAPALTHLLAQDADTSFSEEEWTGYTSQRGNWGFTRFETTDDSLINKSAQDVIRASRTALEPVEYGITLDDYLPGPVGSSGDFWTSDRVSVSSGSGPQDYDNDPVTVTGIRFSLAQAVKDDTDEHRKRSLRVVVECNVETVRGADPKAGFGNPVPGHSHDDLLCRIGYAGESLSTRLYFSSDSAGIGSLAEDAAWNDAGTTAVRLMKVAPDGSYPGTGTGFTWAVVNAAVGNYRGEMSSFGFQITSADLLALVQSGGIVATMQARARSRYGIGISEVSQNNFAQMVVRVWRSGGTGFVGTALAAHSNGSGTIFPAQSLHINRTFGGGTAWSAVASAQLNDWIIFEPGTRHIAPTSGGTGSAIMPQSLASSGDLPYDESTSTALNSFIDLTVTGAGAVGADLPLDTVRQGEESTGTALRASRCGHQHAHGLLSADGTNYHDQSHIAGLTIGGLGDVDPEIDPADGDLLTWDADEGLWIAAPPADTTSQRWEAVTDGENVFVWEDDDLVHEWKAY